MKKLIELILVFTLLNNKVAGQNIYSLFKEYTVSIGYVDSVTINYNPIQKEKRFILVGSGLLTYNKYDTSTINSVITARHVIKFFEDKNLKSFFIRFSWADSIQTSIYFGTEIQLRSGVIPFYFYHQNPGIDLGCILLASYNDPVLEKYYGLKKIHVIAYNDIKDPELGDNVLIYGYPGHIEDYTSKNSYIVCTFKPGMVTWRSDYETNTFLDDILMVESNASFGNSGGPVFYFNNTGFDGSGKQRFDIKPYLVGILVGGTNEITTVKLNGQVVTDNQKNSYYVENRSGVSTVVKAKIITELLNQVNIAINKPNTTPVTIPKTKK